VVHGGLLTETLIHYQVYDTEIIMNKTPTQSRLEQHEEYKKVLAQLLHDFFVQSYNLEPPIKSVKDLNEFIAKFIIERIKTPQEEWNTGENENE